MSELNPKYWLSMRQNYSLSVRTIEAYERNINCFSKFCEEINIVLNDASNEHIALYVRHLHFKPAKFKVRNIEAVVGLSNASILQHLTTIRLYYDFLLDEGYRKDNPVGRGKYINGNIYRSKNGLLPKQEKFPWIPNAQEWEDLLLIVKTKSLRTRLMLCLAYDGALRREELCSLKTSDFDVSRRLLKIRAETVKGRRKGRVVPYSVATSELLIAYLNHRRSITKERGPLFVSESKRNFGKPISIWTWSKEMLQLSIEANQLGLSTHTLRHLCLTDLARSGWEVSEIANFAGHRDLNTTLRYIHLSGRDLIEKFEKASDVYSTRITAISKILKNEKNG